ncbi:hypothetical protein E2C01_049129 [Portunus trituberculatus]|uniref:Uncharacterized protein n=1 Tax=Portunus trituberculatus TaxID=210409 RepID=A0A5B7GC17_PORTR|nr:hypothetical protein [Portunus trituberculatus]
MLCGTPSPVNGTGTSFITEHHHLSRYHLLTITTCHSHHHLALTCRLVGPHVRHHPYSNPQCLEGADGVRAQTQPTLRLHGAARRCHLWGEEVGNTDILRRNANFSRDTLPQPAIPRGTRPQAVLASRACCRS